MPTVVRSYSKINLGLPSGRHGVEMRLVARYGQMFTLGEPLFSSNRPSSR
jgi:hypothetical protein